MYIENIKLISKCPDDWHQEFVRESCENAGGFNIHFNRLPSRHWPVFNKQGHNFRNMFCAICNGQNYIGLVRWALDKVTAFKDEEATTFDLNSRRIRRSEPETSHTCTEATEDAEYDQDDSGQEGTVAVGNQARECFPESKYIATCPYDYPNNSVSAGCLSGYVCPMCHQDDHEVHSSYREILPRYANPYCMICNEIDPDLYRTCSFIPLQVWFSLKGVFSKIIWQVFDDDDDLESATPEPKSCLDNEVFDFYSSMCRPVSCAPGFKFIDGDCIINPDNRSFVKSKYCVTDDLDIFTDVIDVSSDVRLIKIPECVLNHFISLNKEIISPNEKSNLFVEIGSTYVRASVANDTIQAILNVIFHMKGMLEDDRQNMNQLFTSCNIRAMEFVHACRKITPAAAEEPDCGSTWYRGEIEDFHRVGHVTRLAEVYLYKDMYIVPEYTLYIETFLYSAYLESVSSHQELLVCGYRVPELSCASRFTLYQHEYELLELENNDSVLLYAGKTLPNDQFVVLVDGRAQICAVAGFKLFDYSGVMDSVNFAGNMASLVCLAATVVTHVALPGLHNRPHGEAMIYLNVALFVAQLLPLLTANVHTSGLICISLAVISHFAWLASFSWMSLIAINLADSFAFRPLNNPAAIAGDGQLRISTRVSHMIGWGAPTFIVAISVVAHVTKPVLLSMEYGADGVCWISDVTANLIFFGIPVAISILLNFGLFICTTKALSKSVRNSRELKTTSMKLNEQLQTVLLYIKVTL